MDNWDTGPFAQIMQPIPRPCEDSTELDLGSNGAAANEWWVDPADHTQAMPLGFYSFFETLWVTTITLPPQGPPYIGEATLHMQLLDAAGAVLSEIKLTCTIATDWGPPFTWSLTVGAIDYSNAMPVATFNGIRWTVDKPDPAWPDATGSMLFVDGARAVGVEGAGAP